MIHKKQRFIYIERYNSEDFLNVKEKDPPLPTKKMLRTQRKRKKEYKEKTAHVRTTRSIDERWGGDLSQYSFY